jgi:hypothetical protein
MSLTQDDGGAPAVTGRTLRARRRPGLSLLPSLSRSARSARSRSSTGSPATVSRYLGRACSFYPRRTPLASADAPQGMFAGAAHGLIPARLHPDRPALTTTRRSMLGGDGGADLAVLCAPNAVKGCRPEKSVGCACEFAQLLPSADGHRADPSSKSEAAHAMASIRGASTSARRLPALAASCPVHPPKQIDRDATNSRR